MIRPRPRKGAGVPKVGAALLTVSLLVGAQAGLAGIPVPAFASGREIIRELDALILERFAAPAPAEPSAASEEEPVREAPEEPMETVSFDEEVGEAMAELERRFGLDEVVATPTGARPDAEDPDAPGIEAAALDERFESLFGAGDVGVAGRAGRGRVSAREGRGGLAVGIDERIVSASDSGPTTSGAAGPDVTVRTGAQRDTTGGETDVVIRDLESEGFDGSEAERLAVWLRGHRSELPIGVRVHMNFEPSFLTASVPFQSDGRNWELYLMYNETLRELHVVLVDGDRSVYLIDRDFQEQSRSLREGTVRRQGGVIVAIDSRTGAASSERARELYDVFLSWWESARNDVGR